MRQAAARGKKAEVLTARRHRLARKKQGILRGFQYEWDSDSDPSKPLRKPTAREGAHGPSSALTPAPSSALSVSLRELRVTSSRVVAASNLISDVASYHLDESSRILRPSFGSSEGHSSIDRSSSPDTISGHQRKGTIRGYAGDVDSGDPHDDSKHRPVRYKPVNPQASPHDLAEASRHAQAWGLQFAPRTHSPEHRPTNPPMSPKQLKYFSSPLHREIAYGDPLSRSPSEASNVSIESLGARYYPDRKQHWRILHQKSASLSPPPGPGSSPRPVHIEVDSTKRGRIFDTMPGF